MKLDSYPITSSPLGRDPRLAGACSDPAPSIGGSDQSLRKPMGKPASIRQQNALERKRKQPVDGASDGQDLHDHSHDHPTTQGSNGSTKDAPGAAEDVIASRTRRATSPASKAGQNPAPLATTATQAAGSSTPSRLSKQSEPAPAKIDPQETKPATVPATHPTNNNNSSKQTTAKPSADHKPANPKPQSKPSQSNPNKKQATTPATTPSVPKPATTSKGSNKKQKDKESKSTSKVRFVEEPAGDGSADEEEVIDEAKFPEMTLSCQDIDYPPWIMHNTMRARERTKELMGHEMVMTAGVLANNKQEKFIIQPKAMSDKFKLRDTLPDQDPACSMLVASNTQDPNTREFTDTIIFDDITKPVARYEAYGVFVIVANGRQLKQKASQARTRTKHEMWTEPLTHGALCAIPHEYIWFGLYHEKAEEPWAYLNIYVAGDDYEQMEAITLNANGKHDRKPFMEFVKTCSRNDGKSELKGANVLWRRPSTTTVPHPWMPQASYDTLELRDCHPDNPLFAFFVTQPITDAEFPTKPVLPLMREIDPWPRPEDFHLFYQ